MEPGCWGSQWWHEWESPAANEAIYVHGVTELVRVLAFLLMLVVISFAKPVCFWWTVKQLGFLWLCFWSVTWQSHDSHMHLTRSHVTVAYTVLVYVKVTSIQTTSHVTPCDSRTYTSDRLYKGYPKAWMPSIRRWIRHDTKRCRTTVHFIHISVNKHIVKYNLSKQEHLLVGACQNLC